MEEDAPRVRAYADSARIALEQQQRDNPTDAQTHALRGVALAYLGRKAEAIREGERAVEMLPSEKSAFQGPYNVQQLARIYVIVGEPEKAIDQLESLQDPLLCLARLAQGRPTFDPLRKNPRFQKLVKGQG